jgi:hypothetical protein
MSIRTNATKLVFGLSLVTLAAGCPLLEVEAEMPEVCMTHRDVEVAGVPAEYAMGIDETFAFDDLSAFEEMKDLDADLRFVSATIRATHGVGNLAFIDAASVQIASNNPDSTLPTRAIYACASGSCPAQDNALAIPVQDQDDALEYIRSGSMSISVQATGNMPTEAWKMDVEICVAGRASYSFEP